MSNIRDVDYYLNIAEEILDTCSYLGETEREFLENMTEQQPKKLSDKQIDWLEKLERKYLL
jgi:hypothetical protein